jgi:hypothetical protein
MATARTARRKTPVRRAGQILGALERRGTSLLVRAEKRATRYMSPAQRRAVRDLRKHATGLRADIGQFLRHSRQALQKRAERVLERLDPRAARMLRKTLGSFRFVTEADLGRLELRLVRIERRVETIAGKIEHFESHRPQPRAMRAVQ